MSIARRASLLENDRSEIDSEFAFAVVEGLSKPRKSLPCRYFYDARGSELFEEITRLPEYYPTRTEACVLADHAHEMIEEIGAGDVLVEFGSGSSLKTEILLARVHARIAYVPIDVSAAALAGAEARLSLRFRHLDVRPLLGDFSQPIVFPSDLEARRKIGFFPGSTIGNLSPPDAIQLLAHFGRLLGADARLIVGIDLKKDARTLVRAYDDSAGVTAAFNLNLLARINRELGANFDTSAFRHEAIYDPVEGRIEMHLVSVPDQMVALCGRKFHFDAGERIHTENSYKYSVPSFQSLASASGWRPVRFWTDAANHFSVHELQLPSR